MCGSVCLLMFVPVLFGCIIVCVCLTHHSSPQMLHSRLHHHSLLRCLPPSARSRPPLPPPSLCFCLPSRALLTAPTSNERMQMLYASKTDRCSTMCWWPLQSKLKYLTISLIHCTDPAVTFTVACEDFSTCSNMMLVCNFD